MQLSEDTLILLLELGDKSAYGMLWKLDNDETCFGAYAYKGKLCTKHRPVWDW